MTTATVQLTGPQLEVIALLAAGKDVNEIAFIIKGTQVTVNGHIRAACLALGAYDRIHLMAVAYQARLLRVPGVEQVRSELARTQAALATARTEAGQAAETITMLTKQRDHARKAATVAEAKLKEAPSPAPARAAEADPFDAVQAQNEIERLKRAARAATDRADRAEARLIEEQLKNTPVAAGGSKEGPWGPAIAHLERLAAQTRDAAQRGGIAMVQTAKGVDLSIAALRRAGGA